MAIPGAALAGMSLAGGAMGAKNAKNASKPTKTKHDPWRQGDANWFMDKSKSAADKAYNADFGPSDDQNWMYNRMKGSAFGPGGGGGGGGDGFSSQYGGGGGGGGGGNKNMKYAKNNVAWNDYEKRVTDAGYMNVHDDPILQAQQQYRRGLHDENTAMSMSQALSPFAGNAATMGFTGANLASRAQMQQGNERDWMGMENEMYAGERNARRQEAMGANQAWSGREQAFDVAGMGADAQRASARMAANASRYNTDSTRYTNLKSIGSQNAQNRWNQQMQMYGMAGNQADMMRRNQGLGQMDVMQQYGGMTQPWQQGFGTTTSTPPQQSQLGGFLGGSLSGAMSGMSLGGGKIGGMFGNLFGGGKSPAAPPSAGYYPTNNYGPPTGNGLA